MHGCVQAPEVKPFKPPEPPTPPPAPFHSEQRRLSGGKGKDKGSGKGKDWEKGSGKGKEGGKPIQRTGPSGWLERTCALMVAVEDKDWGKAAEMPCLVGQKRIAVVRLRPTMPNSLSCLQALASGMQLRLSSWMRCPNASDEQLQFQSM